MFAGNFAPRGWAFCNGQILPVAQNQALFSILGTTYGGDGETNFALPDLRGRFPLHHGSSTGPGLSGHSLGQKAGTETETLNANQIPGARASTATGTETSPQGNYPAVANDGESNYATASNSTLGGGAQAHNNMPPYQAINFIIALVGIFPSE